MAKGPKFSDAIRQVVNDSGLSRYAICKQLGISQALFSRFMAGAWLGQKNMDALAALLGLSVTMETKVPQTKANKIED